MNTQIKGSYLSVNSVTKIKGRSSYFTVTSITIYESLNPDILSVIEDGKRDILINSYFTENGKKLILFHSYFSHLS